MRADTQGVSAQRWRACQFFAVGMAVASQSNAGIRFGDGVSAKGGATDFARLGIGANGGGVSGSRLGIQALRDGAVTGGGCLAPDSDCCRRFGSVSDVGQIGGNRLRRGNISGRRRRDGRLAANGQRVPFRRRAFVTNGGGIVFGCAGAIADSGGAHALRYGIGTDSGRFPADFAVGADFGVAAYGGIQPLDIAIDAVARIRAVAHRHRVAAARPGIGTGGQRVFAARAVVVVVAASGAAVIDAVIVRLPRLQLVGDGIELAAVNRIGGGGVDAPGANVGDGAFVARAADADGGIDVGGGEVAIGDAVDGGVGNRAKGGSADGIRAEGNRAVMGYNRVVAHRRAFRSRLRARAKGGSIDAARLRRRTDGSGTARVGGGFRADGNGIQAAQSPGGAGAGTECS